jgi:lipopolysaccharide exporter
MRAQSESLRPEATPEGKGGRPPSLIGGALSLTLCSMVSQVINYGIHIGVGRIFTPGIYGYFGIIVSIFSIMETILRWGLARAVAFYVARDRGGAGAILRTALRVQAIYVAFCFLLFFSLAEPGAALLGDASLASYLRWGAFFIVAFAFVPVYSGFLNGVGAFAAQGVIVVIRSVAKVILIAPLLALGLEIYGVIAAYVASTVVAAAYGYWVSRPDAGGRAAAVRPSHIVAFGLPIFVSSLAAALLMRMDLFMIQSLLGDPALTGLYAAAAALIKAPYFITLGPSHVVFRRAVQLRAQGPAATREFVSKAFYYYLVGLAPIPFILAAAAEPIMALAFGAPYLAAAPVLQILSFCFVSMILFELMISLIAGLDRPRWGMLLSVGLLPAQFFLIRWWIGAGGLAGVALATTVCWTLGAALGAAYLIRLGVLVLPNWKCFFKVGAASAASYYATQWSLASGLWAVALAPVIYALYLAALRLAGELDGVEVRALVSKWLPAKGAL